MNPKKDVQYTVRVRKTFVFEQQKFSVVVTACTVKEGEQKTRLCCPEGSYPTYAGCFYIEYIFLTSSKNLNIVFAS